MDLKTVQQQLKASIAKHQMLMSKMKSNPQDASLKMHLQEIQKHIAKLGAIQKNLVKHQRNEPLNAGGLVPNLENGAANISLEMRKETCDRVKASPSTSIPFFHSTPYASGSLLIPAFKNRQIDEPMKIPQNANVSSYAKDSCSFQDDPVFIAKTNNHPSNEPLNLSSNHRKPNNFIPLPVDFLNKSYSKGLHSEPPRKKLAVPPSMKLGMTIASSSNASIRAEPTPPAFKPLPNSGLIRLPSSNYYAKSSAPKDFSRFVISVTASPSGQTTTKITPSTSSNTIQMGAVHKNWLTGRKIPGVGGPKLEKNHRSEGSDPFHFSKLGRSTSSSELKSAQRERVPLAKTFRSFSAPTEQSTKKNHFLAYLNLITKEKAEKLRNRRSGRRRAVAHPVYSGGLYVSHSTTNTKRVIPPELLDIGLETIPTKRPRGRPKGSTNKRSFSPNEVASGVDEEYYRILQQAKPSEVPTVEKDKYEDVCDICNKPGEFLMCDTCSRLYHMGCLTPPLCAVPSGMWYCDSCKTKIEDQNSAAEWPGLLSIVQSFFAFNSRREVSLVSAKDKCRSLKNRKCKLAEEKKVLAGVLKEKVCGKAKMVEDYRKSMRECENLTSLLERLRCAINKKLEDS